MSRVKPLLGALSLTALLLASACGGDDSNSSGERRQNSAFERSLRAAQRVSKADFPPAGGRTLQQVADGVLAVQTGLAT